MARDLSRFHIQQPSHHDFDEYEEGYLPPEVAAYLEQSRRRPYVMRGILAGSLIALAGLWIILEARRNRRTDTSALSQVLPPVI